MGNNPAGKKVNTPKGKYLGKYLLRKYPGQKQIPFYFWH